MALDIQTLLSDKKVNFITSGPEVTRGWVNIQCPFCGDTKYHLGYSNKLDMFTCWKCGPKNKAWTLHQLLDVSISEAHNLCKEYFVAGSYEYEPQKKADSLILPDNEGRLISSHKRYLKDRGFDPALMNKRYGMVSASKECRRYANRILIPIYKDGVLVSFHSRSVNSNTNIKTKVCKKENEVIDHKDLIYNFDNIVGNTIIVSEGPFDAIRWGDVGGALFGIRFTERQVDLLTCFKNIFLVFDSKITDEFEEEKVAVKKAEELADKLGIWNNVWLITELGKDPADLSQRRADKFKEKILKKILSDA